MAQQVTTRLIDDLDGTELDVRTTEFAFNGRHYEIDLSSKNWEKLHDALAPFIDTARKTGGRRRGRKPAATANRADKGYDQDEVRTWARANGFDVKDRGRIPAKALDAYLEAH
jgi:hypothetical protein